MFKDAVLLGSTGSIGEKAAEIFRLLDIPCIALAAGSNYIKLENQARLLKPRAVAMEDENAAAELKIRLADTEVKVFGGREGVEEVSSVYSDIKLNAIVGIAGLSPTLAAIKSCKRLCIANKEALVCAGELVLKSAGENGVEILPVDSEHSAIFQALAGRREKTELRKIIITASGGPFLGYSAADLEKVTLYDALKHPNWQMGKKITVDSATLMNKGLEVIEAMHLFGTDVGDIEVVVHRESIIHSMVEYVDGSVIAQLGIPDMHIPIQYAITHPHRYPSAVPSPDFTAISRLSFEKPDTETFRCLPLAISAARRGGGMCTVLNGANEMAVEHFLREEIPFSRIPDLIGETMRELDSAAERGGKTLEDILALDREARRTVEQIFRRR